MKLFLIFIGKLLAILLLSAFVLDFGYSYVFSKSTKRNKVESVISPGARDYDVIMLGSSRANNHFVPELFAKKGYKSFNYGISGSRLQESALLLQLMMDQRFTVKNIILELDLNINSEGFSEGTRAVFMPYLKSHKTISNYYRPIIPDFDLLYYVPFYRYIKYDSQIGFREMFFSIINRPSRSVQNLGFYALKGEGVNMKYDLLSYTPKRNKDYELIKKICKENNINLIVVSTPMCENVKGLDYFNRIQQIYPEVYNYEHVVSKDKYFSSCGHLNEAGARLFTAKIIKDFF